MCVNVRLVQTVRVQAGVESNQIDSARSKRFGRTVKDAPALLHEIAEESLGFNSEPFRSYTGGHSPKIANLIELCARARHSQIDVLDQLAVNPPH